MYVGIVKFLIHKYPFLSVNFVEDMLILSRKIIYTDLQHAQSGRVEQRTFSIFNFFLTLEGKNMELTQSNSLGKLYSLSMVKSFLIWTFALAVCLLVVGFPLVVLMVTVGALLAIVLQSVLPISAVLLVAGGLIGVNVLAVVVGAAVLTLKGVHPHEVRWLSWLHGEADALHTSVYAACPLTCDLDL
jgi:hypothetical protein